MQLLNRIVSAAPAQQHNKRHFYALCSQDPALSINTIKGLPDLLPSRI